MAARTTAVVSFAIFFIFDVGCSWRGAVANGGSWVGCVDNGSSCGVVLERSAAAVRERIRTALAIVCDESPDGHRLHRMVDDANRAVVNAGRDAEQNHTVLCAEFCRRLFHDLVGSAQACFRRPFGRPTGASW